MNRIPWCGFLLAAVSFAQQSGPAVVNLAFSGTIRSWESGAAVTAGHEAAKANDGRFHTYWMVRAENLPADLGIEWPAPRKISSVIVRYFDGRMVRGPAVARTQQGARLQQWDGGEWRDIDALLLGQETSSVRYVFEPLTTARIRLLFTEPPDPEARNAPGRIGIYVCELEAYSEVPFQRAGGAGRLTRGLQSSRDYKKNFNEPMTGDTSYDYNGPLIIEPKQTRVYRGTLAPTLIVAESRWAREACAAEQPRPGQWVLRNGFLALELAASGALKETRLLNRVTGEAVATPQSRPFILRTAGGELTPADLKVVRADASGSNGQVCRLRVDLTSDKVDVAVHYELRRQDHFFHKWLMLANKAGSGLQVRDVVVSSFGMPRILDLMAGQELTYPVFRMEEGGFFSCLETVYWDHRGDEITYYPGVTIASGGTYLTEKGVVGVYKNRGEPVAGWDRGVREWVIEYHAQVSPIPDAWPDVYCEAWSAKFGVREILERPEWSERFMATAAKLGIRYMDMFEPTHEGTVMPDEYLKRLVDLGDRFGIATGFWTDFGSDSEFGGFGEPLKPHACKLSPEAQDYFRRLVELVRKYKFRALHWGDFLAVWPCDKTEHGHLPGRYSIYAQGQRVLRFRDELHEASPGIMLGADGGFTNPQYVRLEDSRAHGIYYGGFSGDHWPSTEPDIHLDRLYADMNRVWVNGGNAVFLRPWFRMINGVNHFGQETQNHDRAGFRYGVLSALAMAAQVTFNDVPVEMPESEIQFARRWFEWARANKDYLKQGDKLFDQSLHFADVWQGDGDALSGFSHIRGDRGYVFLMNPTPLDQVAELTLALDAAPGAQFAVEELYPVGGILRISRQGEHVSVTVPGKQVLVLRVAPGSAGQPARKESAPRYLGDWKIVAQNPDEAKLRSEFVYPENGREYLASSISETLWGREPWAYDKAYLVLLFKDEREGLNNNWVPDNLALRATVNGVPKTVRAFKTRRVQPEGSTRCYFVDLQGEVKAGGSNAVELTAPVRAGLVFSGAYLDLPDQVPPGAPPQP